VKQLDKAKRALSYRQARRCENAQGNTCRCRCGGTLHGRARGGTDRGFFEALPETDPHFLKTKIVKRPSMFNRDTVKTTAPVLNPKLFG